jgi:carbon storage regulator CsrA
MFKMQESMQDYKDLDLSHLVLTREEGQMILIGDNIRIEIGVIKGRRVKIIVHAPRSVEIDRKEYREKVKADKR